MTTTTTAHLPMPTIPYENRPEWYRNDYTKRAYNIVLGSMYNSENWKLPSKPFTTNDLELVEEITHLLSCDSGGHEVKYTKVGDDTHYTISSKGYYYYIGS
jgi:hypothetical protein